MPPSAESTPPPGSCPDFAAIFAAAAAASPADPLFTWERPLPWRATPFAHPARQIRSRHTRERLIAAVECVVRELGPSGATVRRIAERAGVSVGTVYRRFPNKAALMHAVRRRFLRRREDRIRAMLQPPRDRHTRPADRVRRLAQGLVAGAERDREMTRAFGKVPCSAPELPAPVDELLRRRAGKAGLAGELLVLLVRAVLSGPALPRVIRRTGPPPSPPTGGSP